MFKKISRKKTIALILVMALCMAIASIPAAANPRFFGSALQYLASNTITSSYASASTSHPGFPNTPVTVQLTVSIVNNFMGTFLTIPRAVVPGTGSVSDPYSPDVGWSIMSGSSSHTANGAGGPGSIKLP